MYARELKKIRQFLDSISAAEENAADPQHCFDLVEEAVNGQARIMADLHLEPSWELPLDDPYQPLLF